MMRDSSSVKLTWSLSRGPASGGYHQHHLAGITQRHGKGYQLIRYDLEQDKSLIIDLDVPLYKKLLLYGSNTRAALILVVIAEITWNLMKHWPNAP
jgi:hypothetical protein